MQPDADRACVCACCIARACVRACCVRAMRHAACMRRGVRRAYCTACIVRWMREPCTAWTTAPAFTLHLCRLVATAVLDGAGTEARGHAAW